MMMNYGLLTDEELKRHAKTLFRTKMFANSKDEQIVLSECKLVEDELDRRNLTELRFDGTFNTKYLDDIVLSYGGTRGNWWRKEQGWYTYGY